MLDTKPTRASRPPISAITALIAQIRKLEVFRHGQVDSANLDDFDTETEQLILRTFGDGTTLLEAYELATMGEAESIVNIPQAAQEDAAQDIPHKALEQRRQVLEACLSELGGNSGVQRPARPSPKPAKKVKRRATKKKARAMTKKAGAAKKKAAKKPGPGKKKPRSGKKKKAKR